MKIPEVLMLGWEFPPVINGGLGIACHDLSIAMAEFANVTMIIPKAIPGFNTGKLNVIGLNNIDVNSFEDISRQNEYGSLNEIYKIPMDLDPYYSTDYTSERKTGYINEVIIQGKKYSIFDIDNLYGGDVIHKVIQFGNIAAKLSERLNFDIIHTHDWMTMVAGMEIKARSGKPLVMHIHSLEVDRSGPESKGWMYDIEKQGMEAADLLMPVSRFTAENIVKYYGIDPAKIVPVHNGIRPVVPFKSVRPYKEKTVLFIGRLTRQKGPEYFLQIASKILKHNPDVRFVVAGAGESFRKMLLDSSYSKIGNRFHLTGFINQQEIKHLLSISDVYLMPSVSEPFGLSAVEAAQFQIPCVISKQSGVAEVLSGSLKFDFWDVDRAADYVLNLIDNPMLNSKVVDDANKNLKLISWNLTAKKVVQTYRDYKFCNN
ncbi:MAG: glycosyltransferase [Bacteroidetes bacterium]|nr:glycosyltransferase [Bacteroidota bacterium]HET6244325.1 glycosyltransferase [Bacteroidia bacterium]